MIRLMVVVLLVVAFGFALRWRRQKPATRLKKYSIVIALVVTVLLLSGRLAWIIPLLAALLLGTFRLFSYLLRCCPFLQRLWHHVWRLKTTIDQKLNDRIAVMRQEEALEVLGLDFNASKEEIVAAHRRLIQKCHPDRGGSNYLAVRINQAKEALLKK